MVRFIATLCAAALIVPGLLAGGVAAQESAGKGADDSVISPGTVSEFEDPVETADSRVSGNDSRESVGDDKDSGGSGLSISGGDAEPLTLTLEDSLGIAITNNFELRAIGAKKEIYSCGILEKWRDYFPSLSVSYLKSEQTGRHDTDSRRHTLSFESNITVYDGGKRGLAYDIAKLESILARNDYRIALNRLIMQVQAAYLETLQLKGTAAIHKKTLENGMRQLAFIRMERDLGEATPLNVLEIETKVMETRLDMERALDEYATALNRFKQFLKIKWRRPIELTGDVESDYALYPPPAGGKHIDVDEYVALALKNRKEVESGDVSYAIHRRAHQLDRLYYFPKFSVGLKYSLSDDNLADRILPRDRNWGIMFKVSSALWGSSGDAGLSYDSTDNGAGRAASKSASVRIMDSLSYRRGIIESRINMLTAKEKALDTRERISLEVLTGLMNLDNSWKMIRLSKKWLDVYDALLGIERLKADMGETIRYELVKKELERGRAAVAHLDARVKYLVTASSLEIAMGLDIGELRLSTIKAGVRYENE